MSVLGRLDICNTAYRYYNCVKDLSAYSNELLAVYFQEYLDGLKHDGLHRAEQKGVLDKAKTGFPFMRYVLERHGIGMDEFIQLNLNPDDYAFYKESTKPV